MDSLILLPGVRRVPLKNCLCQWGPAGAEGELKQTELALAQVEIMQPMMKERRC